MSNCGRYNSHHPMHEFWQPTYGRCNGKARSDVVADLQVEVKNLRHRIHELEREQWPPT